MIARALLMRPKLLLADEATSRLDASLRVNVLNVLADLRDQSGMTVLIITCDIGQACYVANRVLVMEHSVMVEQGQAEDVIFRPPHEYAQRLLADVPKLHESAGDAPARHATASQVRQDIRGGYVEFQALPAGRMTVTIEVTACSISAKAWL